MMGIPKKNYVAAILATSMCHLVEGPQKCRKCYTIFDHALPTETKVISQPTGPSKPTSLNQHQSQKKRWQA